MSETPTRTPAPARPASTVVILRDSADGIEVFMVVRNRQIEFASGALVFPGGKVDKEDSDEAWAELAPQIPTAPDRSFFIAAGRETFEEAGLVLARRRGSDNILDADAAERLVETYRAPLLKGETTFVDIVRRENLALAGDLMVPFAHWITPEVVPKRFDTHFFLITAPMIQLGAHDGGESTEGIWIKPQQALADAGAGNRTLVFATRMNLEKLARYGTVTEAVEVTRSQPVVTVMPKATTTPEGRLLHIPAEAGYGVSEVFVAKDSLLGTAAHRG
jgi:8-oxo-dGTP pyrophosphatase MutT (NUDIX family)